MGTRLRKWSVRLLWAGFGAAGSAAVTAIALGLVRAASLTPSGWRNAPGMAVAGVVTVGGLLGLGYALYEWSDERSAGRETAVAVCVALTALTGWVALRDQAFHDRGRPVQAVVTTVRAGDGGGGGLTDPGRVAVLEDASGRRLPGTVGAWSLAVGDRLTVTVDPLGRYDVRPGPPPAVPVGLWELSALIAGVQALFTAWIGLTVARSREARPRPATRVGGRVPTADARNGTVS